MCLTSPPTTTRIDNTGLGIALLSVPHIPLATLVGYVAPEGLDHLIYEVDSWAFEVPN